MARAIQFKSFALSLLLLALLVSPRVGQAVVLDWDTVTWSGGMSQAFNIDSSNSNNGSTNDVFISISGNTNRFAIAPTVNTNLTGGLSPVENGLFLNMDYTTRTESITVLVGLNYSGGVSNLTFTLFDVDRLVGGNDSGYTDKISSIIGRGRTVRWSCRPSQRTLVMSWWALAAMPMCAVFLPSVTPVVWGL